MFREPTQEDDAIREAAVEELFAFPPGCHLRFSETLSLPEQKVFWVLEPSGRETGTVTVEIQGGIIMQVKTRPIVASGSTGA